MNLRVLFAAEEEATRAACWYEDQLPGLGDEFLVEIKFILEKIEKSPQQFGLLETLKSNRDIRRHVLRRFPFMVIYEICEKEIVVLAVAHTSRKPNYWKQRQY